MKTLRIGWAACLLFLACSPESEFLNSTEKRQVAELTEQRFGEMRPDLEARCAVVQDSLLPILADSILNARIRDMNRKLHE